MKIKIKVPSVTELVPINAFNTKTIEIEKKADTTNPATKSSVNTKAAVNKIKQPDIANAATRVALNAKATYTENEIIDTTSFISAPEFNRLSKKLFDVRIVIEELKILRSKFQLDAALDTADKNEEKDSNV